MNQNKTGKYFKYAIGEIGLVVIGILIALGINNWNANQKTAKEEISILNNLLESLYSAKEQSDIEISKEIQLKDVLLMALGKRF
jgi:predicted negative regulator of RcsB-dependent stress response